MSSLKHVDTLRLEKFLEMRSGYVCNFSDRAFRDFVMKTTGIDVYAVGYEDGGTSKANRLRNFWRKENDFLTAKLLREIIEYQKVQKQTLGKEFTVADEVLYKECLIITGKLVNENLTNAEKPIEELSDDELQTIIRRAENTNISDNLYQRANGEWQMRQSQEMLKATKNKSHEDDLNEIKIGMLELLSDPQYTKRKFSLFKKRFYGLSDNELRSVLRSIGALAYFGKENGEQWGLRSRNSVSGGNIVQSDSQQKEGPHSKLPQSINISRSQVHFGNGDLVGREKVMLDAGSTKKNFPSRLHSISAIATILAFGFGVYVYFYPESTSILGGNIDTQSDSVLATSTVNISDVFSKYHSLATALEQRNFLEKYKDAKVIGSGTFKNIDKPSDNYFLVSIQVLFKKDQDINFTGVFTMSAVFGGGWSIRECGL